MTAIQSASAGPAALKPYGGLNSELGSNILQAVFCLNVQGKLKPLGQNYFRNSSGVSQKRPTEQSEIFSVERLLFPAP